MADTSSTGSEDVCWAQAGTAAESAVRSRAEIFQFIKFQGANCSLRLSCCSKLIQRHRPVAGAHGQPVPAAVHLAMYFVTAEVAFDDDGNVGRDTAVARTQLNVRCQISGNSEGHAAIRAAHIPSLTQLRSRSRFHFNPPVAGAQF